MGGRSPLRYELVEMSRPISQTLGDIASWQKNPEERPAGQHSKRQMGISLFS
jgi:hypothetical protein